MRLLPALALLLAALPALAVPGPRQTQIRPGELWEDANGNHINAHGGGFLLHEGRVWWFGEHKVPGEAGNQAWVGVHCYSSPADDLVNWRDEGIALRVSDDPASDIAAGCILERPKVIYNAKTRKFVMWFHLELKGYFRDLPGGQMARDMTLFVDDDGTAYHIYASEENATLQIAELDDTYTQHTGRYWRAFPGRFMEAPALFKKDGKYYFIGSGCTGWAPNAARSAVAPAVIGPWTELGNPARGPNAEKTHFSQSTYALPIPGKPGQVIFCADRWNPKNQIDSRYIWLPIEWKDGKPILNWKPAWSPAAL